MIKNGSAPARLLHDLRRDRRRVIDRADLLRLAGSLSHPDRAIARLEEEGLVDKIDRGLWLVPSGERPDFEKSRFWSNPDLGDPRTISAIVVSKPTVRDITRVLLAYGRRTVEEALEAAKVDKAISPGAEATAMRMIENAWKGIANAARRRSEA